jgi:phosphatidylserine/phosphatidylglycerophosphate/cardiolipin synthase-like enzyme
MFGWREGEVGQEMAALLERKLAEGVGVSVIVDRFGSRPYKEAREMFTGLAAAGAQIVVNDVFPLDRDGLFPDDQHVDRQDEVGPADHRKLYVIDGRIAWTVEPGSRTTSPTAASTTSWCASPATSSDRRRRHS